LKAGRVDWALRLCTALQFFWINHLLAARRLVTEVLDADKNTAGRSASDLDPLRVTGLATASLLANLNTDYSAAETYAAESLELARRLSDVRNEAVALVMLGRPTLALGDPARARQVLEQAIERAREGGDPSCAAIATFNLAYVSLSMRDFPQAEAEMKSALDQFLALQDEYFIVRSFTGLGAIAVHSGRTADALPALRESLTRGLTLDREGLAWPLELMADALAQSDPETAARLMGAAGKLREDLGFTLQGSEVEPHDHAMAVIRAAMDASTLQAALAAGDHLSLAEAAALAMQRTGPTAS
jgi:tetratricopeptide (TPR) repeat protein